MDKNGYAGGQIFTGEKPVLLLAGEIHYFRFDLLDEGIPVRFV
jgi:hypothetical protein